MKGGTSYLSIFGLKLFLLLCCVMFETHTDRFSFGWVWVTRCSLTCPGPIFCQYVNAMLDDFNTLI